MLDEVIYLTEPDKSLHNIESLNTLAKAKHVALLHMHDPDQGLILKLAIQYVSVIICYPVGSVDF